jgi:hypothetical protein
MSRFSRGTDSQPSLGGMGQGSVVKLDGGQRLRMDDVLDFWPKTGVWKVLATGEEGRGASSMFDFLAKERARAGRPLGEPAPVATERHVDCDYCGKPAGLFTGKDVYPHRKELAHKLFWVCWSCDAWVGCHDEGDGHRPLGDLAREDLRDARRAAHDAFDPLWQSGVMKRADAYAWLSHATGIPEFRCRIGMMDVEQCRRVVDAVAARDD